MFIKMYDDVQVPEYETKGSAGMDIRYHGEHSKTLPVDAIIAFTTGLKVDLPEGYELQVRPRSGLAFKHGVTVLNSPGTIDSDFEGEIKVALINHGYKPVRFNPGDRIAQLVYAKVERPEAVSVSSRVRGEGGFGSTDKPQHHPV